MSAAAPPFCACCEAPSASLSVTGLCPTCAVHGVLVAAFAEGAVRLAGGTVDIPERLAPVPESPENERAVDLFREPVP